MSYPDKDAWESMCDIRGVETPCSKCHGYGVRLYGSTSTWRGGIGGQALTKGICDSCWGSGDANSPWLDLRKLQAERIAMTTQECAEWLSRRVGASYTTVRTHLAHFADVIEAESRRRKAPFGADLFWYTRAAEGLAQVLRELAGGTLSGDGKQIIGLKKETG